MNILRGHAESSMPNEACAILLGHAGIDSWEVRHIMTTENAQESPTKFAIPEAQLVRTYRWAEDHNMDVAGIFHSHPTSAAVPSATDETYMRLNPVAWLIYSGTDRAFRAWRMDGDHISEIPVRVTTREV